MSTDYEAPLKITADELRQVSIWSPVSVPATGAAEQSAGRDRLAIAAFVTAVVGIPLFGLVTGLLAIVMGVAAMIRPNPSAKRSGEFAVAGICLGAFDVLGWAIAIAFLAPVGESPVDLSNFEPEPAALENLPPALQRAMKANVYIQGTSGWRGWGGTAVGSGVILKIEAGQGYILTNRHVVDPKFAEHENQDAGFKPGESHLTVKLVGQPATPANILWTAPDGIDLAIVSVRVQSADAVAAAWGSDKTLKIGDQVYAIGNPHGLGWTHTAGVVSQFRQQPIHGRMLRVIQTNAAINPGNSGGGLYDSEGKLVGIPTWTRDKRIAEGLSFAIAFETLIELDPQCLKAAGGNPTP